MKLHSHSYTQEHHGTMPSTLCCGETHSPECAHQVSRVIGFVCAVLTDTAVLFTQVLRHLAQRGHRNDECINITWDGLSALQSCRHRPPCLPSSHTQRAASIQPVPACTHHTETLSLIGTVEANLAQLKQHVLLQPPACTSPPTSTSLPAQATIVLPPSGPVQELPLPAKAPSDMNLFELGDANARNITNGASVVLLANRDEHGTTRLCMERTIGCNLVLLRCTAQPGTQLWTGMPSGEICVLGYRHQCLHYDATAVGVNVGEAVGTRSQHWSTIECAQLQLQGASICLGLIAKTNALVLVVGPPVRMQRPR